MQAPVANVNGGGKVSYVGRLIVGLRRRKTVPSAVFYKVDYQPLEGAMDVSSQPVPEEASGMRALA